MSWKRNPKASQTHRRNAHEMDTTPILGITDQFPMVAGVASAEERRFSPC